jgi:hypothetical protein
VVRNLPEAWNADVDAEFAHRLGSLADSSEAARGEASAVQRLAAAALSAFQTEGHGLGRTYLFVSASEPLAAAEAVGSAPTLIDLCVTGPSAAARETAAFACADRPVRVREESLLAARRPQESNRDVASRHADALRALYALDTQSALVVWDQIAPHPGSPLLFDEAWLLRTAELIERHLPLP